jgi:hypothetical protein
MLFSDAVFFHFPDNSDLHPELVPSVMNIELYRVATANGQRKERRIYFQINKLTGTHKNFTFLGFLRLVMLH